MERPCERILDGSMAVRVDVAPEEEQLEPGVIMLDITVHTDANASFKKVRT
jgi:hypothetical protein